MPLSSEPSRAGARHGSRVLGLLASRTAGTHTWPVHTGLCDSCRHQRVVRNTRGSVFSMCERSKADERFAKYPRLPVLECVGYERRERGATEAE
jgi:hypothetical protein